MAERIRQLAYLCRPLWPISRSLSLCFTSQLTYLCDSPTKMSSTAPHESPRTSTKLRRYHQKYLDLFPKPILRSSRGLKIAPADIISPSRISSFKRDIVAQQSKSDDESDSGLSLYPASDGDTDSDDAYMLSSTSASSRGNKRSVSRRASQVSKKQRRDS